MDRKETGNETVDLVNTVRTGSRGGPYLNIVMNLWVHKRRRVTAGFARPILLRGVT
jgi:hypothetical protein